MTEAVVTHYVDEAGDGILFGPQGRDRLQDENAPKFFMLGMISVTAPDQMTRQLAELRANLLKNPLYATIPSMNPDAQKTARAFHAKDDHPEIRSKVFELLVGCDFKFLAVIKDMREVRDYVASRNRMHPAYRYHPNELYDLTVRMLLRKSLHKKEKCRVVFARRGSSDRTEALRRVLASTREAFLQAQALTSESEFEIVPAYPWEESCIQVTDYCLWALQRCMRGTKPDFCTQSGPRFH